MAFQPLSIGDILMLSQQAWKIGRAFTPGRSGALSEFAEVEREANGLSEALKLTAETLHSDGSILSRAEPETRGAVNEILESAGRTLSDLESLVDRYQVIRKRETNGGFVVERSWSEAIIANYRTIKWTTEGGDITELRNMLHMHTNTINLTMQALQSRSLTRLEKTVMPMAENIASIQSRVHGDLGDKIDDLHRLIMSVASSTPSLIARDRAIEYDDTRNRERRGTVSTLEQEAENSDPPLLEARSIRSASFAPTRQQDQRPHDSVQSTPGFVAPRSSKTESPARITGQSPAARESNETDWEFETGSPPRLRGSIGGIFDDGSSPSTLKKPEGTTSNTPSSHRRDFSAPRRESTTLPNLLGAISVDDTVAGSSRGTGLKDKRTMSYDEAVSPTSQSGPNSYRLATDRSVLPPPAITSSPTQKEPQTPATPSSFFNSRNRSRSDTDNQSSPRSQTTNPNRGDSSPLSPALATLPTFEKSLFRNAAILCDVRGNVVEYAQKVPDEPDPRFDTEMVEACQQCRIYVIRKRENRAHGGTKLTTAIWAISEDGTVRCQQKLSDFVEMVPYCSYFEQEKVSIPPTEDGEITLRFHGERWTDELEKEVKTNWVNYIFVSETDAITFQSAVFGRTLIGSFRTTKTTVIHDGLMGTFAFEEQFANIEMLRLWQDDGVATTPEAQGGVLALMHISSNFGEGWARWWMNCSRHQVRVRDDPPKNAKLKGINIIVVKPGTTATDKVRSPSMTGELQRVDTKDTAARTKSSGKKVPVKRVTGVRIEFKTEEEKDRFLNMNHQAQDRMIPLPDL